MRKRFTFIVLLFCSLVVGGMCIYANTVSYAENQEKFEMMSFEHAITTPEGLNVRSGPSTRYPAAIILSVEPLTSFGRIMPIKNPSLPNFVNAIQSPLGDQTGVA